MPGGMTPASEIPIDLGPVRAAVDPDQFLSVIDPIKDAVVANADFAQAFEVLGHPDQPAMDHGVRVLGKPRDLPFHARTDGGIQSRQLAVRLGPYFDGVGHAMWRGRQGLN